MTAESSVPWTLGANRPRRYRDQFVDEVFAVADLPILQVPAHAACNSKESLLQIEASATYTPHVEVPASINGIIG